MSFLQNQYKFVFETLLEYTRGIDSRFPVSELANKIKERGVKDKKTKKNAYIMEYQVPFSSPHDVSSPHQPKQIVGMVLLLLIFCC
jgi:hypothetical protein